jgi:hypothetical protein
MSIRPQNRFPRLVIVGPTDKKQRKQPAGLRWWGPPRRINFEQATGATQIPSQSNRTIVMPVLPRSLALLAIVRIWNFLRGYFVTETPRQQGAAVLSFRRYAAQTRGFRQAVADESFANKKVSGSVRWNSDREVAAKEGGRG